ncbi:MAG: synthase subunit delta [Bacteroidota bacterium]|jgi:F-type H+-transporting ATPase subunit delta
MSLNRITSRYAKSLIELAMDQNILPEVKGDIDTFNAMIQNRDLYLLLKSPIVNATKKGQIFSALFEGKLNKLTYSFFNIVLSKGRENYLPEIAKEFNEQYKQIIGLTSVKLITATPIDAANLSIIKTKLVNSKETAKDVEFTTEVNPDIIGGFVIKIGDKLIDNSIAYKLGQIRKNISNKDFVKTI